MLHKSLQETLYPKSKGNGVGPHCKTAAVMNLFGTSYLKKKQLSFGLSAFEPTVPTVRGLTILVLFLVGRLDFRSKTRRFAETTSIQSSD